MAIDDGGPSGYIINPPGQPMLLVGLRDYLIAHAPAEPQPWFEPEMPEPPKPVRGKDEHDASYVQNWQEIDDWKREQHKQRYIQWPAAWADAMLAERSKRG